MKVRITMTALTAILLIALGVTAEAQAPPSATAKTKPAAKPQPPKEECKEGTGKVCRGFAYRFPGDNAVVDINKVYPVRKTVELTPAELYEMLSGAKGKEVRDELELAIGRTAFHREGPADTDFLEEIKTALQTGKYEVVEYEGRDCQYNPKTERFYGTCDTRLKMRMAFHNGYSEERPVPVGFLLRGIRLMIRSNSAPYKDHIIPLVITRSFVRPSPKGPGFEVQAPCVNSTGEEPIPAGPPATTAIITEEPKPRVEAPSTKLVTANFFYLKIYTKKGVCVAPPKNVMEAKYEAQLVSLPLPSARNPTDGSGWTASAVSKLLTVQIGVLKTEYIGRRVHPYRNDDGEQKECEALLFAVRGVSGKVPETEAEPMRAFREVFLNVRETQVPKGTEDKTRTLKVSVTEYTGEGALVPDTVARYENIVKGRHPAAVICGKYAWRCIAGAVGVYLAKTQPWKNDKPDSTSTSICNPAVSKCALNPSP